MFLVKCTHGGVQLEEVFLQLAGSPAVQSPPRGCRTCSLGNVFFASSGHEHLKMTCVCQ